MKQQFSKLLENNNETNNKTTFNFLDEYESKFNNDENNRLFKNEDYNKLKTEKIVKKKEQRNLPDFKIYGFINGGNNCYLNSSLQLLTRINELKYGVLNFQKSEINEDTDTKGQLIVEFQKILNKIENSKNDNLTISPDNLKSIMGYIDEKYNWNSQEDSNEFISYFINGLFKETASKAKGKNIKPLEIKNESDKEAYKQFHKRFYLKKGYSFLLDIFYGISETRNYCKCGNTITNKFNAYFMLELPLFNLVQKKKNKTLELNEILDEYRSEKKIELKCDKCKINNIANTKILLITFPKYLMLSFIRTVDDDKYISNDILYKNLLSMRSDYDNKIYQYSLECVIEHSGGAHFGHYTALCPKDKNDNIWYRFNDSYCDKYNYDFHSKNALILLYKLC